MLPVCMFEHAILSISYPATAEVGRRHVFAMQPPIVSSSLSAKQL